MRHAFLPAMVLLAGLAGCSVYHPLRDGVGYTETPMGPDRWQVTYVGPYDMPVAEARDYALLLRRGAFEFCNQAYFTILSEQGYISQGLDYVPGQDFTYYGGFAGQWHRRPIIYHAYSPGYFGPPYTVPQYTMTVRPTAEPLATSIPASYLIQRAQHAHVKLSPGVAQRAAGMPETVPATQP